MVENRLAFVLRKLKARDIGFRRAAGGMLRSRILPDIITAAATCYLYFRRDGQIDRPTGPDDVLPA